MSMRKTLHTPFILNKQLADTVKQCQKGRKQNQYHKKRNLKNDPKRIHNATNKHCDAQMHDDIHDKTKNVGFLKIPDTDPRKWQPNAFRMVTSSMENDSQRFIFVKKHS